MLDDSSRPSIVIDRELCLGNGVCMTFAPATFTHDAETKAVVTDATGDSVFDIRAAAEGCPTGAIRLSEPRGA